MLIILNMLGLKKLFCYYTAKCQVWVCVLNKNVHFETNWRLKWIHFIKKYSFILVHTLFLKNLAALCKHVEVFTGKSSEVSSSLPGYYRTLSSFAEKGWRTETGQPRASTFHGSVS